MAGIPSIPKINRFLSSISTSGSVSPFSGNLVISGTTNPSTTGTLTFFAVKLWQSSGLGTFPWVVMSWVEVTATTGYWRLSSYPVNAFSGSKWESSTAEFSAQSTPNLATGWTGGAIGGGATGTGTPIIALD